MSTDDSSGAVRRFGTDIFPFAANDYSRRLAEKSEAFHRQVYPDPRENDPDDDAPPDPFGELDDGSAATSCPGVVQRFPDRVLVMVSNSCFMNCRHCTRRNILEYADIVQDDEGLNAAASYVRERPAVRDVLISGGDPLVLNDEAVMRFVDAFASLDQVDVVRLCTRAPCTAPSRITQNLARRLGESGKVWVNTQFNHPDELTSEAVEACRKLVCAGIPVSCQTVLLAGVNDSAPTLLELFRALQCARVRPYYVFQCDNVRGTSHFRVSLEKAKKLAEECAENIGGLAMPRFVADVPGEKRKTPVELL